MNKWLALLFVTASQVATTTGVTAATIGTQAMLVRQGEIEHPKANDSHTACSPAQPPNTTCPYGIQINSGWVFPQNGGFRMSGHSSITINIEFNATAISLDDMAKVYESMESALSASEFER